MRLFACSVCGRSGRSGILQHGIVATLRCLFLHEAGFPCKRYPLQSLYFHFYFFCGECLSKHFTYKDRNHFREFRICKYSHLSSYRFIYIRICLSICTNIQLSICVYISTYTSIYFHICLPSYSIYHRICLSSVYLSIVISVCLRIYLSVYLRFSLSLCLSN